MSASLPILLAPTVISPAKVVLPLVSIIILSHAPLEPRLKALPLSALIPNPVPPPIEPQDIIPLFEKYDESLNVVVPAKVALFVELSNTNIFDEPPFHFVPKIISPKAAAWFANPPPPEYISILPL